MAHQPAHTSYYNNDIWHDSPLTADEREELRDSIRTLVLDITHEIELHDFEHDAITGITLHKFPDTPKLSISLHLDNHWFDTPPTPNILHDANDSTQISSHEPDYLRDLGHTWDALEYDLISELVIMLDLPEMTDELAHHLCFTDQDSPCFSATMGTVDYTTFFLTTSIPKPTQHLYETADFDTANQLGIPIEK